jgi:hypothetical protein
MIILALLAVGVLAWLLWRVSMDDREMERSRQYMDSLRDGHDRWE